MPAASFLGGLLKGFNTRSASARAESQAEADKLDAREDQALDLLASADAPGTEDIRALALSLKLAKASGEKPPKGGFLAALMGGKAQPHPGIVSLMKLATGPEPAAAQPMPQNGFTPAPVSPSGPDRGRPAGMLPGMTSMAGAPPPRLTLDEAMAPPQTAAPPPPAPSGQGMGPQDQGGPLPAPAGPPPGSAAMAPPPSPGSLNPAALSSPGGPPPVSAAPAKSATPPGGPVSFGARLPLPGTTPSPPRKLFLSTTERALAGAKAKARGDVEGEIEGMIAAGIDPDRARAAILAKYERMAKAGARDSFAEGEVIQKPDGTWVQILYNRYDPTDRIEMPATAPGLKSVASLNDDAQLAHELFGDRYPGVPAAEVLKRITPAMRTYMDGVARSRLGQNAFASGTGAGNARVQTELKMPIGVPAGESQNTDPTRSLGSMAGSAIARPLPQSSADKLTELQDAVTMVGDLDATIRADAAGKPTTGLFPKLATMMPNFVTEYTGWGVDDKSRNAVIALAKQIIGKSFEGGVLRKEDEIKYKDILPTIGDAPGVAASKIALLKQRVQARYDTQRNQLGSAGFRVGSPPPPISGAPQLGQIVGNVFDHTKLKVEARTGPDGQPVYIGIQADGTPVELTFRDGKYFIK